MLTSGPAKKVAIYVAEDQQYHGSAAYAAILDFLFFRGVAGATVTRGIAGFGSDHKLHTTRLVDLAPRLPIKVEFIETAQKVEELLPKLQTMVGTGLMCPRVLRKMVSKMCPPSAFMNLPEIGQSRCAR